MEIFSTLTHGLVFVKYHSYFPWLDCRLLIELFNNLCTGMEGGFDAGERKYDVEELFSIVILPEWIEFPLSFPGLPAQVENNL